MIRKISLVAGFYLLLAGLALYWPLLNLATHLTGTDYAPTTDYYHFHWNYAWMRHALTTGADLYQTDRVMAPFTSNLAYHTLTPFWFPLWALVEPLAGTVAAMTAIFIASMALAGLLFYGLLRREGASTGLALAGGAMLALAPVMFSGVFWTNINLMGWFWLPALMLLWGRAADALARGAGRAALAWAMALGVAAWAMVLTDLQYPLFALFVVIPYGLRSLRTRHAPALIALAVLAGGVALALLWVTGPLPHLLNYDRSGLVSTPAERAVSIPFPAGYIWRVDGRPAPVSLGVLPLPLLALALIFSRRRDWRIFWLALIPVPLILSLGAGVTIAGAELTLPYRALHELFGGMFRYPERFAPVVLIPAVTFALVALTPVVARLRNRRALIAALLLLIIAESRMLRPFPLQPIPARYDFYAAMGDEPYDYVVVEVPTGASSGEGIVGEALYSALQFHGLTHGKRMINGHLARVDVNHYWYMRTDDPLLSWLGGRVPLDPNRAEARLRAIIADYPVGYIVVHTDLIARFTGLATVDEVLGYLNGLPDLLCPLWREGDALAYRTTWHPDGCPPRVPAEVEPGVYEIDLGAPDDVSFIGAGWHWPEAPVPGLDVRWTGVGRHADLFFDLPEGGDYALVIRAQSYETARTLRVSMNGAEIGAATVAPDGLADYTLTIPAAAVGDGRGLALGIESDPPAPVPDGSRTIALMIERVRLSRTG